MKNFKTLKTQWIIFCIVIYISNASAQSKFQKDYLGTNTQIGSSIHADSTGFFIAGTTKSSGQGGYDILLMRTDLDGNVNWSKTIGGPGDEKANAVKRTSDGGYIVVGSTSSYVDSSTDHSNIYIIKLDITLAVQWTRVIRMQDVDVANDVVETYDFKFAIVGYTTSIGAGNEDLFILEIDANGNLLWSFALGSSGSDFGNSLIQSANNGFIIVGSTTGFGTGGQTPYLVFTDELGVVQNSSYTVDPNTSRTVLKRYFTKIINGNFNDYLISGSDGLGSIGDAQHFILDISQLGSLNWMKSYILNTGEGVGTSLDKGRNGEFIIGGTMGIDHPALIHIDGSGQILETKFYPNLGSSYYGKGFDVKTTTDGGFALVGYRYNTTDTSLYLVKTNNSLSSGCDEHDGFNNTAQVMNPIFNNQITTSATITPQLYLDSGITSIANFNTTTICFITGISENIQLSDQLQILQTENSIAFEIKNDVDQIDEIKLYSSIGKEVGFVYGQSIGISNLSPGIYYYSVTSKKQKNFAGKFVK